MTPHKPKGTDMTHHLSRRPLALAAALLLASTVAAASPGGPGGPRGGPGMGGPATSGAMVEQVIEGLRDKLSLDSAQQAMFDSAHSQTIAARDRMLASRADIRSKVQAELAKPEPDLAAVSAILETAEEQGRSLRHQARDQWLKVYASLRRTRRRSCATISADGANGLDAGRMKERRRTDS
jgi:Spy/CpxP family protein refolding chaperone